MALRKHVPNGAPASVNVKPLSLSRKSSVNPQPPDLEPDHVVEPDIDVDVDLREVYFLMIHLLSGGPCKKTYAQLCDELLEHQLLPRRYHAWHSRSGLQNGDKNDDDMSFPLTYTELTERHPHIEKDHLVKLLKKLMLVLSKGSSSKAIGSGKTLNPADFPTLLGTGSFSLLSCDEGKGDRKPSLLHMRWPHTQASQVHGLSLRELGGGFTRHHRAPSSRAACLAIAKPITMVQKMQNIKRIRGHRNAVYCAIYDRSGRYVITGSDDRLVKIWSMETAYCLASCRGHEGDITDLAVSSNNVFIASSSNDCVIRVWRLPDGLPVSVLRGHTGAVTAIVFSPRQGCPYQLLSSSDDGTCRIWDARSSQISPRIFIPRPPDSGKNGGPSSSNTMQTHQVLWCAFNANGTLFVTGSSDTNARVWNAVKISTDESNQLNHEIDVLSGHENDVNYVQFSGCAAGSRFGAVDNTKEENIPKFKNSWYSHDNIVTCSRDGSAIIWIPRSRRSHGRNCRWTRAYHLKVPPPPMPPQPPRGGPRQRILPTPRGVNMIVWSLDNRFVLAAIMDCRICVWNASDGSLVHSLTGHSASTFVLDVHPFNPRIAMSAGYDGKTIIWDIWEGIPIQVYEISRYRLVDGKFSPDGTSIILSDDVGQLYILSTGVGESQKEAQYDQFFLGDYRPLIQDAYGNVLDQETQLPPYRRNMEDPLCDSGMIPYPEPYQTMFQQRRLGALGKEWRPSSLKLAVGPDITLDQDYQVPPLADLDLVIEPLPEFADIMDWEPENNILSDDNDSEYNVPEEYSTGGERVSLSSSSSSESDSNAEESDDKDNHVNSLRRSKRKKPKAGAEIVTSSGRRIKRKNLDEADRSPSNSNRVRKERNGRKELKKKSSKSKSSRPRRVAARNALTWFSKITGTSKDVGHREGSESGDFSESESTTQDSDIGGSETDMAMSNEQRSLKGKEVLEYDPENEVGQEFSESHTAAKRKRLVLRFPVRNSNKLVIQGNMVGSSSSVPRAASGDDYVEGGTQNLGKYESHQDLSQGFAAGEINWSFKWGSVKGRTPKRMRLGGSTSSHGLIDSDQVEKEFNSNGHIKYQMKESNGMDDVAVETKTSSVLDGFPDCEEQETSNCKSLKLSSMLSTEGGVDQAPDLKDSLLPVSMILRLSTKKMNKEMESLVENQENGGSDTLIPGTLDSICDPSLDLLTDDGSERINSNHGDIGLRESDGRFHGQIAHPKKMFDYVYRRSKLRKNKSISGVGGSVTQESNPDSCSQDHSASVHGAHSNTVEELTGERTQTADKSQDSSNLQKDTRNGSSRRFNNLAEESASTPRTTVGLRSSRNRRSTYHFDDISPFDKKKSLQSPGKGSWLLLSTHEEGLRYIPQKGDEVVYLRQGHQEYLVYSTLKEVGPWSSLKGGTVRAVEFCKVECLEYSTLPGSGDSCCKMILKFTDPSSDVVNKSFKLTLPEVVGFPDFLVERSRYEAALRRNWTCRDKCRVWWKNDGEEDGSWWEGRILAIQPKSPEFPESPWERYTVKYKSDPTETHLHSPWELFDSNIQWEQPHINDKTRQNLLSAFAKLDRSLKRTQDPFGLQKLKQVMHKTSYTNRFPVPLSVEVIQLRLENNYYRSLEALNHDISVMLSNAESYFGRNAEVAAKIARLSDWFSRTFSSL